MAEHVQIFECGKFLVHADAVAQNADSLPRASGSRVFAEDGNAASRSSGKSGQDAQQGGFSRTIAAQQRQAGAAIHGERNVAQRWIVAIILPDAFDHYRVCRRHHSTLRLPGRGRDPDAEFPQHAFGDRRWRIAHQISRARGLRKWNYLANGCLARQDHHQTVQT